MDLVAPLIFLAASSAYLWNIARRRNLREGAAFARRVRALERGRRDAIQRAIGEGRAVDDPADAPFALEWIAFQEASGWGRRRAIDLVFDALLLGSMVFLFWAMDMSRLLLIALIAPLAFFALLTTALQPFARRADRKYSLRRMQAREANQRLLDGRA